MTASTYDYSGLDIISRDQIDILVEAAGEDAAELLGELLEMYNDDSGPLVGQINEAFVNGELSIVSRMAHTMSGSSANIGGERVAKIASELEIAAQNGETEKSQALIPLVKEGFEATVAALNSEIEKLAP